MHTSYRSFIADDHPSSRILVVDDEPRMCESLKFLIEHGGRCAVETAENGMQALKLILQNRFDLFLIDLNMPKMNGIELMEQILSHQPDAVLVMMTGEASGESAVNALRMGAYDCLQKPFDDTDLIKTIDNALANTGHPFFE